MVPRGLHITFSYVPKDVRTDENVWLTMGNVHPHCRPPVQMFRNPCSRDTNEGGTVGRLRLAARLPALARLPVSALPTTMPALISYLVYYAAKVSDYQVIFHRNFNHS